MEKSHRRHPVRRIDSYELIMVRRGQLALFEQENEFYLGPHQFVILEPDLEHGGLQDYSADMSFYWFHFELNGPYTISHKSGHFKRPEIAANLASRLLDEQERNDAPLGACDGLMHLLLLESTQIQDQQFQDPSGLVDRANAYIRQHFHEAISTSNVAEYCACHPDHLGRVFQARMHYSISQSIREHRLRHARSLLRDTELDIEAISQASGFSDAHYFRRCFKKDIGSSPSIWRHIHSHQQIN